MLDRLPANARLVMDAYYFGFDFWNHLIDSGVTFVVRAGKNIDLLDELSMQGKGGSGSIFQNSETKLRAIQIAIAYAGECQAGDPVDAIERLDRLDRRSEVDSCRLSSRTSDKNSKSYPRKKRKRQTGEPNMEPISDELQSLANTRLG